MSVETSTEGVTFEAVGAIREVGADVWDGLANPGWRADATGRFIPDVSPPARAFNPFVAAGFLGALEDAATVGRRTGWLPRHLVLRERGAVAGLVPAYVKTHSKGEYVFDYGWADAFERAGGRYYPKLQVSVPFTPATGPRLLVREDASAAANRKRLAQGLVALADASGASSVHVTFATEADRAVLGEVGYLARSDVQFHFTNDGYASFDDFLAALASRKRKQLKRERRDALADGITVDWVTGRDITERHWDAFFEFYMDTGSRKWGRPYLNRRFFSLLGERFAEHVLLILAKRDGRYIAGALNVIGSDTLFGRYWGCVEMHPFLHFEICYYQAIDFALAHGLERVEAGAQGEHKLIRGYEPVTTHSAHFIVHPALREAIASYLAHERAAVERETQLLREHGPFRKDGEGC